VTIVADNAGFGDLTGVVLIFIKEDLCTERLRTDATATIHVLIHFARCVDE